MHDSQQWKNAESFEMIKGAIIMKIQESFDDPLNVTESLEKSFRKFFDKPTVKKLILEDEDDRSFEQDQFYEEWKIDYAEYKKEVKNL